MNGRLSRLRAGLSWLSLLQPQTQVVVVQPSGLTLQPVHGSAEGFTADPAGFAALRNRLLQLGHSVSVLIDAPGETFAHEALPRLGRKDRAEFVQRKLAQKHRDMTLRAAWPIGRMVAANDKQRSDDEVRAGAAAGAGVTAAERRAPTESMPASARRSGHRPDQASSLAAPRPLALQHAPGSMPDLVGMLGLQSTALVQATEQLIQHVPRVRACLSPTLLAADLAAQIWRRTKAHAQVYALLAWVDGHSMHTTLLYRGRPVYGRSWRWPPGSQCLPTDANALADELGRILDYLRAQSLLPAELADAQGHVQRRRDLAAVQRTTRPRDATTQRARLNARPTADQPSGMTVLLAAPQSMLNACEQAFARVTPQVLAISAEALAPTRSGSAPRASRWHSIFKPALDSTSGSAFKTPANTVSPSASLACLIAACRRHNGRVQLAAAPLRRGHQLARGRRAMLLAAGLGSASLCASAAAVVWQTQQQQTLLRHLQTAAQARERQTQQLQQRVGTDLRDVPALRERATLTRLLAGADLAPQAVLPAISQVLQQHPGAQWQAVQWSHDLLQAQMTEHSTERSAEQSSQAGPRSAGLAAVSTGPVDLTGAGTAQAHLPGQGSSHVLDHSGPAQGAGPHARSATVQVVGTGPIDLTRKPAEHGAPPAATEAATSATRALAARDPRSADPANTTVHWTLHLRGRLREPAASATAANQQIDQITQHLSDALGWHARVLVYPFDLSPTRSQTVASGSPTGGMPAGAMPTSAASLSYGSGATEPIVVMPQAGAGAAALVSSQAATVSPNPQTHALRDGRSFQIVLSRGVTSASAVVSGATPAAGSSPVVAAVAHLHPGPGLPARPWADPQPRSIAR